MKKSGGKLLGILLTASLMATALFPMQGMAVEEIERTTVQEVQAEEENASQEEMNKNTISADTVQEEETKDPSIEPSEEETKEPSTGPSEEKTKEPSIGSSEEETEDTPAEPSERETEDAPIKPATEMDDFSIMPFAYDINKPVIESFEFVENGQTLSKNDTLHFSMSAYDADRDIKDITVQFKKSGYSSKSVTFYPSEDNENLYTGTYDCSRLLGYEGSYYVTNIEVQDHTYNYVEWPVMKDGKYLYTFTFENTPEIEVSNYQMQKNSSAADGKLRVGDTVTYTAHVECKGAKLGGATLYLKTVNSASSRSAYTSMQYDEQTKTLTGTYKIANNTYPSDWTINYISVSADNNSYSFYPDRKDLNFTVINDGYDMDKPVIESITIDKNGKVVKAGESVSIKIKVDDKNPRSSMRVRFSPKDSSASYFYRTLNFTKSTMEYTGTINITRDSYPTRWELTYIELSDMNGNSTSLSDFREDWNTTRPWYYTVDPEGYLNDTKAPVIESITIDKNGQWVQPGDTVGLSGRSGYFNCKS